LLTLLADAAVRGGVGGGLRGLNAVFVRRGVCTFSSKARAVARSKAAAMVLVNNEEGNDHLAGPDAHDVGISVSMVICALQTLADFLIIIFFRDLDLNSERRSFLLLHC
jgi:hypothetical protein